VGEGEDRWVEFGRDWERHFARCCVCNLYVAVCTLGTVRCEVRRVVSAQRYA
jgi:hypothetical protein